MRKNARTWILRLYNAYIRMMSMAITQRTQIIRNLVAEARGSDEDTPAMIAWTTVEKYS